jgi:hypothetical protein
MEAFACFKSVPENVLLVGLSFYWLEVELKKVVVVVSDSCVEANIDIRVELECVVLSLEVLKVWILCKLS